MLARNSTHTVRSDRRNRSPSAIPPPVPGAPAAPVDTSATSPADTRWLTASTTTSTGNPTGTSSAPPSGAPTSRATPSVSEFTAFAPLNDGPVPTTTGVCACTAGRNSTVPVLSTTSATYTSHRSPGARTNSNPATAPARTRSAATITRRRSHRSTSTPATGPSTAGGRNSAANAAPASATEPPESR